FGTSTAVSPTSTNPYAISFPLVATSYAGILWGGAIATSAIPFYVGRTNGLRIASEFWVTGSLTNVRINFGLFTGGTATPSVSADQPAIISAYVVYSNTGIYQNVTDSTHYMFCVNSTASASTQVCTSTGITAVLGTPHKFEIYEDNSGTPTWRCFVDGVDKVDVTANIPPSGTAMWLSFGTYGISTITTQVGNFSYASLEEDMK